MSVLKTTTVEEMYKVATDLLPDLLSCHVVLLKGDLGSGKTTFAQGVGKALGIEEPLRSPTFTLVNIYDVEHDNIDRLVHTDFYRLEKVDEDTLRELGLDEFMKDDRTLVLVEWPERMPELNGLKLEFTIEGDAHNISK